MTEWCDDKYPLRGIEICVLDEKNMLTGGFPLLQYGNTKNLPIDSICRIYTEKGNNSGFLYNSPYDGLVVLSDLRSYSTVFDLNPKTELYAIFGLVDHDFHTDFLVSHENHPTYRTLKPIPKDFNVFSIQLDPITQCPYSIPNGIIVYEIVNTCICGRTVLPLVHEGLEIASCSNLDSPEVILLGYPGRLSPVTSHPLKSGLTVRENILLQNSMKENQLVWTEGCIVKSGDLLAISNSSAEGMSGAPLLTFSENKWKVIAMLCGGPAVAGHHHIMKLGENIDDEAAFRKIFRECKELMNKHSPSPPATIPDFIDIRKRCAREILVEFLETYYYGLLSSVCKSAISTKGVDLAKEMFNHNLAIPLINYQKIIDSNETPQLHSQVIASNNCCCIIY